MAERGGQPGNQNAIKGKRWADAIQRALEKKSKGDGIQELDRLAEEFIALSAGRDPLAFFKELGDRIDGKANQPVEHSGDLIVRIDASDANL